MAKKSTIKVYSSDRPKSRKRIKDRGFIINLTLTKEKNYGHSVD